MKFNTHLRESKDPPERSPRILGIEITKGYDMIPPVFKGWLLEKSECGHAF